MTLGTVVRKAAEIVEQRNLTRNKSPLKHLMWGMPDIESPLKHPPEIFSMGAASRNCSSPDQSQQPQPTTTDHVNEGGVCRTIENLRKSSTPSIDLNNYLTV